MSIAEILSITISILALIISGITAYRTLFAKFKSEIYVRPRVFLSRLNKAPCVVAGCEISNQGAHPGSLDDIVLRIKYRQHSTAQGTKSINTYTFLPTLLREEYNVFRVYEESDFEPFQRMHGSQDMSFLTLAMKMDFHLRRVKWRCNSSAEIRANPIGRRLAHRCASRSVKMTPLHGETPMGRVSCLKQLSTTDFEKA